MPKLIRIDNVIRAITNRLTELGLNLPAATIISEHVVRAEVTGQQSHGLLRLPKIIDMVRSGDRNGPGSISQSAQSVLSYRANGELGIVAVTKATEKLCEVARDYHVAVMAVTDYYGNTGVLGAYTRLLSESGLVGIALCGSDYAVAPHGGRRAILGTNPIAIGFPARPDFSADLATAAWSYGNLKLAMAENREIPTGVVQDIHGLPSTDPHDADNGSQLPIADHKGYALGLAVELLCGPFIGGKSGRDAVVRSEGVLLIALRVDSFRSSTTVARETQLLFDEIRNTPLVPGADHIRIPGDRYPADISDSLIELNDDLVIELGYDLANE